MLNTRFRMANMPRELFSQNDGAFAQALKLTMAAVLNTHVTNIRAFTVFEEYMALSGKKKSTLKIYVRFVAVGSVYSMERVTDSVSRIMLNSIFDGTFMTELDTNAATFATSVPNDAYLLGNIQTKMGP